jgi:D-beta-D-heptose 7-phosphate kinase / D-beta-D-heptose 1-phosphate adenosyltransferase
VGYNGALSSEGILMKKLPFLPDFASATVMVVGDVMLDRYWYGSVKRISPEAPVPVVNVNNNILKPGGAANVSTNISSLGANVSLLGLIGDDEHGAALQRLLVEQGVATQLLQSTKPTITKLRVMEQYQQLLRADFEEFFEPSDCEPLPRHYQQLLGAADVVVLSDYAKGSLSQSQLLIQMAREQKKCVLVDPKGCDYLRYRGATLLTPNLQEFEAVVGHCANQAEMSAKGLRLMGELQLQALLVTLGKDGMLLLQCEQEPLHFQAKALEVFDVTGAGDTVIAVIAAALAAGEPLANAVGLANIAAGIVVGKLGSASVNVPELRRALLRQQHSLLNIVDYSELLQAVDDARSHNETIVMTNGCFDILHAGHVQYLQQAKALGKRLIVAVNDDSSVKALKGDARPINSMRDRMEVVAGLRCVDWVVAFSESTPEQLIARVKPDVLVKGDDYQIHEIAGSQIVLANGGEVKTLPLRVGLSTSGIIEKIAQEVEKV